MVSLTRRGRNASGFSVHDVALNTTTRMKKTLAMSLDRATDHE